MTNLGEKGETKYKINIFSLIATTAGSLSVFSEPVAEPGASQLKEIKHFEDTNNGWRMLFS